MVHDSCEGTGPFRHLVGWCATELLETHRYFVPSSRYGTCVSVIHGMYVRSASFAYPFYIIMPVQ